MDYATAKSKLQDLKSKAKAARKEGKKEQAKVFTAGAKRVQRKLRSIPKPAPAPEAAGDAAEE